MKNVFFALAALFVSQPAAQAASLASIDCLASNGVTIKGAAARSSEGLAVETRWGYLRKDFRAVQVESSVADTTVINLNTKVGTEYQVVLGGLATRNQPLKATGAIYRASETRGVPHALVAYVSCDVLFR